MTGECHDQIINRSVFFPGDPNAPVPAQFLGYPRDNMFPKVIEEKKRDPPSILEGESVEPLDGAKRQRVNIEGESFYTSSNNDTPKVSEDESPGEIDEIP